MLSVGLAIRFKIAHSLQVATGIEVGPTNIVNCKEKVGIQLYNTILQVKTFRV